ncbi:uncharacterized protein LOC125500764 isoform X2 [Athalia rosae]|uniref:uncharacterized protein LOC125500764 isoform X2 n=1 Tax=Athalia rosae TaxID=37344 RepID=UPI0020337768|nr:uncharacterized protein LOC125500764 isoform X2 [Athalia rosae]
MGSAVRFLPKGIEEGTWRRLVRRKVTRDAWSLLIAWRGSGRVTESVPWALPQLELDILKQMKNLKTLNVERERMARGTKRNGGHQETRKDRGPNRRTVQLPSHRTRDTPQKRRSTESCLVEEPWEFSESDDRH